MHQATIHKANVATIASAQTEAGAQEHAGYNLGASSGMINLKTK